MHQLQVDYSLQGQIDRLVPFNRVPEKFRDDNYPYLNVFPKYAFSLKNNCSECYGCDHSLESLTQETQMMGKHFRQEVGGTPQWVFRVADNISATQSAERMLIVKVKSPVELKNCLQRPCFSVLVQ